jgi:Mg2+/citrate symporter
MGSKKIASTIQASLITAATIATALIWKDVIVDVIEVIVPPTEELTVKLITALLATLVVVVGLYLLLQTEEEAEIVIQKIKKKKQDKAFSNWWETS